MFVFEVSLKLLFLPDFEYRNFVMEQSFPKPIIVIVSSSNTKPKSLIKLLTGGNIQHDEETNEIRHSWIIDTKYYTANVDIFGLNETYIRSEEFNDKVEALVIHMDTNKETGLDEVDNWLSIEEDCGPEIKLLICNYCTSDTKITKVKAVEWCLKRGFELIELYPDMSNNQDEDDDENVELIKEKFGIDRVVEALQTHMWSNLIMKNKAERNAYLESSANFNIMESSCKPSEDESAVLGNLIGNDAFDDFNELFSQLHLIKESMKSMPDSQRKQCAENMVTAFWHAIGGDEEELADL